MGTSWGWHCADDHQENRWIFTWENEENLVDLPGVWPCWDQFRRTVNISHDVELLGEASDTRPSWQGFLGYHWNHRLLIVNEYRDLYPLERTTIRSKENAITCECRGKPRATIHSHSTVP